MNRSDAWKRLAQCRRLQPDALQVLVSADIVDELLEPFTFMWAHPLIQTARGMCADERPHTEIDALLSEVVDAAKDLEDRLREVGP